MNETPPPTKSRNIDLHPEWLQNLETEFHQDYMNKLRNFLIQEKKNGKIIYPEGTAIFAALNHTPLKTLKVVIIGQDPYHGPGQAHGLAFSVKPGIPIPPSLQNIHAELSSDLNLKTPAHGYLLDWSKQGVLLLNAVLTVEKNKAASHQKKGWEQFTDKVIQVINTHHPGAVFILWGAYAQRKGQFINGEQHLILTAPHPSPLSASRGFFGSRPFSKANQWLIEKGLSPIDWQL